MKNVDSNLHILLHRLLSMALLLAACQLCGNQVQMQCQPAALTLFSGERTVLSVQIINHSPFALHDSNGFFLSYHLYDTTGKLIRFDNLRFPFPQQINPQATVALSWPVFFNQEPGNYKLQWEIVKEGHFWGNERGWQSCWCNLCLLPLTSESFRQQYLPTFWHSGNALIDREQHILRITAKNAERATAAGAFFGFNAGSNYPAIWIRDTATAVAYARYFYPWRYLAGICEKFLACQKNNGEIVDWVDDSGAMGKNTVETDQESSLVLAVYDVALENPAWLKKSVLGTPIWRRLEQALTWVWQNKRDPASGLIVSGLTADWGDVENSYADQRAINLSTRSTLVTGIYAQAKTIQALEKFTAIARYLGETECMSRWQPRLDYLKQQTKRLLYLPDRGYFLIHRVLAHDRFLKMEKNILALGGNAEAIAAGLLSSAEIRTFLEVLGKRKREYKLDTISYTLLPPYPLGFFPHPVLTQPWTYQNGGAWDWFGGKLVLALFRLGFRDQAERYLLEMIPRHLRDNAISEWQDRAGQSQGAYFYIGTAGVIGAAILHGYFGISENFDSYCITPPRSRFMLQVNQDGIAFSMQSNPSITLHVSRLDKKMCIAWPDNAPPICLQKPGDLTINR